MSKLIEFDAKFTDAFKIKKPSGSDIKVWKDSFGDSYNNGKQILRVIMEASHSALWNRNNRFYIPSRMRDNVHTFLNGNKPAKVLVGHNPDLPPIGIIRGARYVDTVPEGLKDHKDVITLLDSTASVSDQISAFKNLMLDGVVTAKDWRGLGYVELVADIMDTNSIEMINDGRYDAVSTSFKSPGNIYCFVCDVNWGRAKKLPACAHEFGKTYEDDDGNEWPMALIPTLHLNEEVSFVLKDADPLTSVRISDNENIKNDTVINYDDSWLDNLQTFDSKYEFKDKFEEEINMPGKKKIELSDSAKAVLEVIKGLNSDMEKDKLNEIATKIADMKKDDFYPDQEAAGIDEKTAIEYAFDSIVNDGEINADEVYSEYEKEFDDMVKEGIFTEDQIKDAKLSTESRKKLPSSSFCGPERSFPVNDCAHYTAALRLIGRYKGPGNKSSILACINRKGKALGCTSAKSSDSVKDSKEEVVFTMPQCDSIAVATDEEIKALYNKAEAEMISRTLKLDRPCAKCADYETETKNAQNEVLEITTKLADAENTVNVLRNELRLHVMDYAAQVDANIEIQKQLDEVKKDKLSIVGALSGKYKSIEEGKDALANEENIESIEVSIMDNINFENIIAKVNDGTDHIPAIGEPLEDPSGIQDNHIVGIDNLDSVGKAAIETFKDYLNSDRIIEAERYFNKMKTINIFPKEFEYKNISAVLKTKDADK